jgi:hypothetical protein
VAVWMAAASVAEARTVEVVPLAEACAAVGSLAMVMVAAAAQLVGTVVAAAPSIPQKSWLVRIGM